jgi:hypothetical protein
VPDVTNESKGSAAAEIELAGYTVETRTKTSREQPGTVLQQKPAAGTTHKSGSVVTLVVADQWPRVPDLGGAILGGVSVEKAKAKLHDLGLHTEVVWKFDQYVSMYNPGHVLRTNPAEGGRLMPGKTVTIVAAKAYSCTPGYSVCLPPRADYNCAGGSGEPPYVSGPVRVTGSDPYGLDGSPRAAGLRRERRDEVAEVEG